MAASKNVRSPGPDPPRSLAEVVSALARIEPRVAAPREEWLAFHRRSATWYAEIAEIDRGHHHEALFMAGQERECAEEIAAQIRAGVGGKGGQDGGTPAADIDARS